MTTATKTTSHITGIGGQRIPVHAIGTLHGYPGVTQFAPDTQENILSISELTSKGWSALFGSTHAVITTSDGRQIIATRIHGSGGLYRIDSACYIATNSEKGAADMIAKHRAFGHIGEARLRESAKIYDIDTTHWPATMPPCKPCLEGKATRAPVSHKYQPTRNPELLPGQRLHCDLIGPVFRTQDYFLDCTDEATRYEMAIPMTKKSQAPAAAAKLIDTNYGPRQHGPDEIHADRAGELTGGDWQQMCLERGIRESYSAPYTAAHNGIAERNHGTCIRLARTMIADSGLDPNNAILGKEAYLHSLLIHNITPHTALPDGKTPYEAWHGVPARIGNLLPWGTPLLYFTEENAKFARRVAPGYYMGPALDTVGGAVRIYTKEKGSLIVTRNFKLDVPGANTSIPAMLPQPEPPTTMLADLDEPTDEGISFGEDTPSITDPVTRAEPQDEAFDSPPPTPIVSKSAAARKKLQVNMNIDYNTPIIPAGRHATRQAARDAQAEGEQPFDPAATQDNGRVFLVMAEPNTYKQAMTRDDAKDWFDAAQAEAIGLFKREAFDIVLQSPLAATKVKTRWVFKTKTDQNNNPVRYKARLVACGYAQIAGIDYFTVHAPVAAKEPIRTVFALAAQEQLQIRQFDFDQAYVNADLDTDVHVLPPDGLLEVLGPILDAPQRKLLESGSAVLRLNKALYGLKQSGRLWYEMIRDNLTALGFKPTETDPCIFIHADGTIVVIYVDDGLIFSKEKSTAANLIKQLQERFTVKDLGAPKYFVGWTIHYASDGSITLHQRGYAQATGESYAPGQPAKPTPILAGIEQDHTGPPGDQKRFAEMIGSLLFAAVSTRPDIAFATSFLSRSMQAPTKSEVKLARNVIAYTAATADLGLRYKSEDQLTISTYCDASFAPTEDMRKSRTGYIVMINGTPVAWKSAQQPLIAHSTAESEYIALSDAARDTIHIDQLIDELHKRRAKSPITMFEDNQTAKHMAEEIATKRSKYVDLRYHYIRQMVAAGRIIIEYCHTENMLADALTKALPRDVFCRLRDRFMAKGEC
jgi:transposase InsO family protein